MRVLHLALADDWEAARALGEYQVSTRGVGVEAAGFIHAATAAQLPQVAEHLYSDVRSPLVVLVIDLDEVKAAGIDVAWEPAALTAGREAADLFPHIYGPLPTDEDTVAAVLPVRFEGRRLVLPEFEGLDVADRPPTA